MGTRSLTKIYNDSNKLLVCIYGQYDGYPSGHGKVLSDFIKDKNIVNGIGTGNTLDNSFNGMDCFAAALVAHLKTDIGGFYLYPHDTDENIVNYTYHIRNINNKLTIQISGNG